MGLLDKEKDFIEEKDERSKVIDELYDPEEIQAAKELIREEIDAPRAEESASKETAPSESEPKKPEEKGEDTSEKPKEKTEPDEKPGSREEPVNEEEPPEGFVLTDEIIRKQPEAYREILTKYRGKSKSDLAKAAANAIALKSPYLKDNEEAVNAIANKFDALTEEEIVKTLIETQTDVGKKQEDIPHPAKIELPPLPEKDEKFKSILQGETVKRLLKKYPDMPEDMSSDEYLEWERDLQEKGLEKTNEFLSDLKEARVKVKTEIQKHIYAQTNLVNLFNESPAEILPILTDENIPRLKNLNDNYVEINNNSLQTEVELIKKELSDMGISETDLGLDLSLVKDNKGSLSNDELAGLYYDGKEVDGNVIGMIGKVPYLKKGQLLKKFLYENNRKILTLLVRNQSKESKAETERLKSEALNTAGVSRSAGIKPMVAPDRIKETYDPAELKKIKDAVASKL